MFAFKPSAMCGLFALHFNMPHTSLQNAQTGFYAHPASYSMDTGVLSLLLSSRGVSFNHSPPSNAEVMNQRRFTLPTCLHGVERESFTWTCPPPYQKKKVVRVQIWRPRSQSPAYYPQDTPINNAYYISLFNRTACGRCLCLGRWSCLSPVL